MHRGVSGCFNPPPAQRLGETAASERRQPSGKPLFQSAPSPKAGGNRDGDAAISGDDLVSIRPQPKGWGKRGVRTPAASSTTRFQSAPSPKAGGNDQVARRS